MHARSKNVSTFFRGLNLRGRCQNWCYEKNAVEGTTFDGTVSRKLMVWPCHAETKSQTHKRSDVHQKTVSLTPLFLENWFSTRWSQKSTVFSWQTERLLATAWCLATHTWWQHQSHICKAYDHHQRTGSRTKLVLQLVTRQVEFGGLFSLFLL